MHFDTVVVGAGAAGAILATRLSENLARSVCLIEAGRDYASIDELPDDVRTHPSNINVPGHDLATVPIIKRPTDWGFTARSSNLQSEMPVPRGKIIGGSSSVNGMVFFRALPDDLNAWAAAGNPDWSYDAC